MRGLVALVLVLDVDGEVLPVGFNKMLAESVGNVGLDRFGLGVVP